MKGPRAIKMEAVRYFKMLYSQPEEPYVDIFEGLLPSLSREMAVELERMLTLEEIKEVVWSCNPSKTTGYDGFNLNFIIKLWHEIGIEIVRFVQKFFEFGSFSVDINRTWVALIPKVDGAEALKEFRPISMVGCLYKIIAKILVEG